MKIQEIVKKTAKKYVGESEIKGNMGFDNPEFDRKMRAVGFVDTHAWCAYFTELVWKEAYQQYNSFMIPVLDKLFSASAVQTFRNFEKSVVFETSENDPEIGDVVIWQNWKNGKPHWTGHAGIVIDFELLSEYGDYNFTAIEGNTNSKGGREGFEVAIKDRDNLNVGNGLNVLGFIHLAEVQ